MQLINHFKIYVVLLLFLSCTDTNEEVAKSFSIEIKNESSNTLIFEGWRNSEIIIEETILNNSFHAITYSRVNFSGLYGNVDSLAIKFENNKGYLCTGELSDNLCFQNRDGFNMDDFDSLGNNTYEFTITQADFENAFELPDL